MTKYNYALNKELYTLENALWWGNFSGHCEQIGQGNLGSRVVHLMIAALEFFPGISQIASIFEMYIVTSFSTPQQSKTPLSTKNPSQSVPNGMLARTNLSLERPLKEWTQRDVKQFHQRVVDSLRGQKHPMLEWSRWSDAHVMPSMLGLKQLGLMLTEKHRLQKNALCVCETLQAFQKELNEMQNQIAIEGNFRRAFIIPTHSTTWGANESGYVANRSEEYPQHILAVVAEKRGDKLHLMLLDPMIRNENDIIKENRIGLSSEMKAIPFSEQELVLSYIVHSTLEPTATEIYHSNVLREKSNGCWAFALKDAISFLKSPDFFDTIRISQNRNIQGFNLKTVDTLLADFIKTAQFNNDEFNEYFKQHPEQDSHAMRKKIKKHQVKDQNQRIGHTTVKWLKALGF